ncbi:MAG: hypothetical protein FH761_16900 [Firmicutes bacterium]|nr:hypothetical protein [Bacillota bacterium]
MLITDSKKDCILDEGIDKIVDCLIYDYDSKDVIELKRLEDGELNKKYNVYFIRTKSNEYILKKSQNDYEAIIYEKFLREKSLPVPNYKGKIIADGGKTWFLLEFIEGKTLREGNLSTYCRVGNELAKLHCKFLNLDLRSKDYSKVKNNNEMLMDKLDEIEILIDKGKTKTLNIDTIKVLKLAAKRLRGQPQVLIHDDLLPINIINNDKQIKFIDWEHACIGCYSQDIGRLLGDYKNDKGNLWVDSRWEEDILATYCQSLCDESSFEISWNEFKIDYNCSKLWNYANIVLAHIIKDWKLTKWYYLNYNSMIEQIEKLKELDGLKNI